MAEAAARREARRRRILENSENRLRVISGLSKADDAKESSEGSFYDAAYSPPLIKKDDPILEYVPQNSQAKAFESPSVISSPNEPVSSSSQIEEKPVPEFPFSSSNQFTSVPLQQEEPSQSFISTAIASRIHLIGLALLVRLLLSTSYGYWIGESVFVPLFTLQLIKYCGIFPRLESDRSSGGILNAVLLLSGLPARQISRLLQILGGLKGIMEDTYIYLFSFVLFHVSLELITP
ncbi:guided entry of tail-anchored proteins factor CAMLG [Frankliniella occidentalis]|uniref:Guided entry of tail-anchored proteins factor CAMLG n=1 Tax=Frankliniella occidentalis TaxID=133901 RepID=A0A6J1TDK9_FRAOC|nr:guided entry of tail-anchored proteins factor CAMLG [Frankliniella occidentalis]